MPKSPATWKLYFLFSALATASLIYAVLLLSNTHYLFRYGVPVTAVHIASGRYGSTYSFVDRYGNYHYTSIDALTAPGFFTTDKLLYDPLNPNNVTVDSAWSWIAGILFLIFGSVLVALIIRGMFRSSHAVSG